MTDLPRPKARRRFGATGVARYRRWWTPLVWCTPMLIGVVWFHYVPFAQTVGLSFTDARPLGGAVNFVGLDNYAQLLQNSAFWNATLNSVLYMILAVPLIVVLPLLLGVLVSTKLPLIGFFRSAFYIPAVASTVVVALAWQFLLRADGPINTMLLGLGWVQEALPFLTDRWLLLFCSVALTVWKGLGFYMILYIAALGNVDKSLYDAAEIDGASAFRRFWHVTLPGVRPMMVLVGVLSAIGSLRVFTEVFILGGAGGGIGGRNATLPFFIREVGLSVDGNLGLGSAASVLLFLLTLGFIVASQRRRKDEVAA
ncbi:carbohydrate ABC transporter permease [Microbacterium sp. MYb62]|uniref:carbohydrate ABC transporter permease n=1 Tax=Microbacterium sp. MYb62 TaxID=1848690 RepID=UPI000CFC21AF|nr:sugar ABC transporter permease [Microbacterium sp. MYb62]PRB09217.1 ABC transporter permease [Microbacterium sp. MYb62]